MIKLSITFGLTFLSEMEENEFLAHIADECLLPHLVEQPQRADFKFSIQDFEIETDENVMLHKGLIEITCENNLFNRYTIKNLLRDLKINYPENYYFSLVVDDRNYNYFSQAVDEQHYDELSYKETIFN